GLPRRPADQHRDGLALAVRVRAQFQDLLLVPRAEDIRLPGHAPIVAVADGAVHSGQVATSSAPRALRSVLPTLVPGMASTTRTSWGGGGSRTTPPPRTPRPRPGPASRRGGVRRTRPPPRRGPGPAGRPPRPRR